MSDHYPQEPQTGALARMDAGGGGIVALAQMSDEEFEWKLALLKKGRERITRIHAEMMVKGADYDAIPGTGTKPTLLQPGAEKLCQFYGLAPEYVSTTTYGDGIRTPDITVTTICRMHAGSQHGPVVGESVGVCTNWEKKYRYRRGERSCPACGGSGTIIKGKEDYGGGWLCFKNKGGCGAKFKIDDPVITRQATTDVPNPDPYELLNTITKMSEKRSLVGACKFCTATSHLYTQDVEDLVEYMGGQAQDPPKGEETDPPRDRGRSQAPRNQPRTNSAPRTERPSAPESSGDRNAANGGKCLECKASKGHSPTCSIGKGAPPASTPAASEPKPPAAPSEPVAAADDEAQRRQEVETLRAVWRSCDGPDDETAMKNVCAQILTQALGTPTKVMSITLMPADWARICHEKLFDEGIPHVDPFHGE